MTEHNDRSAASEGAATREYVLRAMAKNYAPGNSWDRLDAEACIQAADEIKRLTEQRDEARQLVIEANNSLYGSQGYFHSLNGGPFDKHHLSRGIEDLKAASRRMNGVAQPAPEPFAYFYERATARTSSGKPALWQNELTFSKPDTHEFIRNVKPLYAAQRPKCKLCGLEDGACICAHLPPQCSAGNDGATPWWKILADNWRGRNGNTTTGDSVRNSCADELEKCAARHHTAEPQGARK